MEPVSEITANHVSIKPPLKWAGGKRWLVERVLSKWQPTEHRRFVEPLCGGLAIALGLMPRKALLNDINPHAINFYHWLKKGLKISLEMENDEAFYYSRRARFNELISLNEAETSEAASLFYYLNRTCYNGLCRFNRKGEFNVPFGRYKRIGYRRDFTPYREVFRNWTFLSGDFQDISLKPDDFVYADPPYDVQFTQYAKEDFGWDDQVRLAEWLAQHSGPVVLSNQATKRVIGLYKSLGFQYIELPAPRLINCTGDRTPAQEVLATKNL
jgi:DNA adenine methylase